MRNHSALLLSLLFSLSLHAASENKPSETNEAQFDLDKGLVDSIYKDSIGATSSDYHPYTKGIVVTPQVSFVSATALSLSNNYWDVPYADQVGGLPAFSLNVTNSVYRTGGLNISVKGTAGYSFKEGVVSALSKLTGTVSPTIMTLHWLPLSLGTRIEYQISSLSFVRPHLDLEGGAQWLFQTGKLDGIEQGFWVPFYQASLGLTLFSGSSNDKDWFGGLVVGASLRNSFASQQNIRNWSMDVGLNLYL